MQINSRLQLWTCRNMHEHAPMQTANCHVNFTSSLPSQLSTLNEFIHERDEIKTRSYFSHGQTEESWMMIINHVARLWQPKDFLFLAFTLSFPPASSSRVFLSLYAAFFCRINPKKICWTLKSCCAILSFTIMIRNKSEIPWMRKRFFCCCGMDGPIERGRKGEEKRACENWHLQIGFVFTVFPPLSIIIVFFTATFRAFAYFHTD